MIPTVSWPPFVVSFVTKNSAPLHRALIQVGFNMYVKILQQQIEDASPHSIQRIFVFLIGTKLAKERFR